MITLNDYLYNGDTVLKILHNYSEALRESSKDEKNPVDLIHCNFLLQLSGLLEHNEFLTAQSQKIREFYKYMAKTYPFLAFTFKGRIKSLIRAEEKFNGYIVEYIYDYYIKNNSYPTVAQLKEKLNCFRDLLAYRIVISMPKCHITPGADRKEIELKYLYEIANALPEFMEDRGFSVELSGANPKKVSTNIREDLRDYFRDYVVNSNDFGYQSLHVTLFDNTARCFIELQLRTKDMDDFAEIGPANHLGYEKRQEQNRRRRDAIPEGECIFFDEAYERGLLLQKLELNKLDVNMFAAANNSLINDGCGLYRGRLILPFEHLSRFQNDIID